MVRWMVAALAAAVAMYAWGFAWWGALPFGHMMVNELEDTNGLWASLHAGIPGSGVYGAYAPGQPMLYVFFFFNATPASPVSAQVLGLGFLHGFVAALIAGYLLAGVTGAMNTYGKRVGFVFLLGLFANFGMRIGDLVWLQLPGLYSGLAFLFGILNWLIAGLVLAALIKAPVKAG